MGLLDEIRAGTKLKSVPDEEKNDRSDFGAASKLTAAPASAPTRSDNRATPGGGTAAAAPMSIGEMFANGVPKLRSVGGGGRGYGTAAVTPAPPPPPSRGSSVPRPPLAAKPQVTRAAPPPPPPKGPRSGVTRTNAPPPPPPQMRVGSTVTEPIVINQRPKTIRVSTPGGDQPPTNGGMHRVVPPPPPSSGRGREHPIPPPPPVPPSALAPQTGNVAALSAEFEKRFQFLQECDLPAPPPAYRGPRTYRRKTHPPP